MQINTPTLEQGGWMDPSPPRVFDMLPYFKTILPSEQSLWSSLQDEVYFMGGGTAGGGCDVNNNGRHLGFYQELEIRLKPREMVIFVLYVKNNT